jgi:hypothetical protein
MKKIQKLASTTVGSNSGQLKFSESRGSMNGIILVANGGSFVSGDKCTITYVPNSGDPVTLVTSVPLTHLLRLSELVYGSPLTPQAETILSGAGAEQESINIKALYIDLGHIQLDGGHKLEINFDFAQATRANFVVKAYSFYGSVQANIMKKYYLTDQTNHTVDMVRMAFIVSTATNGFDNGSGVLQEMDISKTVDGEQCETDLYGLASATALFADTAVALGDGMVYLHQDNEGLPCTLGWNYTGTTSNVVTLIVADAIIPSLVSAGTVHTMEKNLVKTISLESSKPEIARAYRHANISFKSDRIGKALEFIRTSGTSKQ